MLCADSNGTVKRFRGETIMTKSAIKGHDKSTTRYSVLHSGSYAICRPTPFLRVGPVGRFLFSALFNTCADTYGPEIVWSRIRDDGDGRYVAGGSPRTSDTACDVARCTIRWAANLLRARHLATRTHTLGVRICSRSPQWAYDLREYTHALRARIYV